MKLTGRAKELFEEWVHYNVCNDDKIKRPYELYDYSESMQWGSVSRLWR